ncbi:hypothetical protein BDV24DRAFT_169299 [Aspergillus arachidicola]|uniref:Uncharacterized protein n=1 Tax=Aspergillus arachidicola TaxID=656916 RepID=A0A5N6XSJ3_9EURO|nr:hypothetical protein BDV24DRAFT_169299 [Aspergillus arachidicola]
MTLSYLTMRWWAALLLILIARNSSALPSGDSLVSVPIGLCAGILGKAFCGGNPPATNGLLNVPVHACIAAVGVAKCSEAISSAGSGGELINVPVSACVAGLGKAQCDQLPTSNGLINIPINVCLAALGQANCGGHEAPATTTPPIITSPPTAPGAVDPPESSTSPGDKGPGRSTWPGEDSPPPTSTASAGNEPSDAPNAPGSHTQSDYSRLIRQFSVRSQVYFVNYVEDRLESTASVVAIPTNFTKGEPSAQILAREPGRAQHTVNYVVEEFVNK